MDYQAVDLLKYILQSYPKSTQPNGAVEVVPFTNDEKDSHEVKSTPYEIILAAAKRGNTRFVIKFLAIFPNLVSAVNKDGLSIFHIAVVHRHIGIYNLLYEIGAKKDIIIATCMDEMKNNILHLVGMNSNNSQLLTMSRASLLMQRELLWFKEVEKMTPSWMRNSKNENGLTPYELFAETNKHLVSKGLKWTKDCMVVATLIITITFAAAFTVPGGYNQPTGAPILSPGGHNQQIGTPIFALEPSFLIFIIADAVSLFSSSTSLLVFLSIVTSPYGQRDFLYSLPRKLMIGLLTLFISVAAMMVTFAASFFVLYRSTTESLPILISIFAATPVVVFAALQYPLLMDMFRSMYDSRYLFKPKRRMLYNRGQRFQLLDHV